MNMLHMRYQHRVKKGVWSSFLNEFLKNIQNKDFGLNFLEKGHILRLFSGIAPKKIKILSRNLRVQYVHIYIYIYKRDNGIYILYF